MGLVTLSNVRQTEYERNWDAMYGAGDYAKTRAMSDQLQVERSAKPEPELTEAEKAAQAKRRQKNHERWQREEERRAAKIDHDAYRAGKIVGNEISLQDRIV